MRTTRIPRLRFSLSGSNFLFAAVERPVEVRYSSTFFIPVRAIASFVSANAGLNAFHSLSSPSRSFVALAGTYPKFGLSRWPGGVYV